MEEHIDLSEPSRKHAYIILTPLNRRGGSNEYPQSMFWAEIWKISDSFIWTFSFFGCKIFNKFE